VLIARLTGRSSARPCLHAGRVGLPHVVSHTMPAYGAGSHRIVVTGGTRPQPPPPASAPTQPHSTPRAQPQPEPIPRDMHPSREPFAQKRAMQQTGWTTRRLTIAGALGAGATLLGGLMFMSRFGVFGANDSPLLAMGFGLFVIGMVVFCASLVALLGTGIALIAERSGWAPAAGVVLAPLALAWGIYALGAVVYAVPAVLSLVLIGGLVVALK